jgi:hypothetical protein
MGDEGLPNWKREMLERKAREEQAASIAAADKAKSAWIDNLVDSSLCVTVTSHACLPFVLLNAFCHHCLLICS